jgi:hypothetical protein
MKQALPENRGITAIPTKSKFIEIAAIGMFLSAGLFAPLANASVYTLVPGGSITATSSSFPTGGTVLATTNSSFASASGSINGTVISTVYSGGGNPYGGLTFTYLLMLSGSSTANVSQMTVGSYGGFLTDVSYNPIDGGTAPSNFTRSITGNGDAIRFLFSNAGGLAPGQNGELVVVQTSATSYGFGPSGVIDGQTADLTVLTPVPEPEIGGLIAIGLGGLCVFRRRNSK